MLSLTSHRTGDGTMAGSIQQPIAHRWLFALGILVSGALLTPTNAAAELIIDDFDAPMQILLPDMINQPGIVQQDIGPLDATRFTHVTGNSSTPTGQVDADISRTSSLNINIDGLHSDPSGATLTIDVGLQYSFNNTDVTQGGTNNRVVVDFAYLSFAEPLARVYAFIDGRGLGHGAEISSVPPEGVPFSLEFPFDATDFDAAHASSLVVDIGPVYYSGLEQVNFFAAIERIRITGAIPEPPTEALASLCVVAVVPMLTRESSSGVKPLVFGISPSIPGNRA